MVLAALINHPERLNRETLYELRSIVARYPYFQTARLLLLNNLYLLHESDFGNELRRSVLYISDRRALCRLIEGYTDKVTIEENTTTEEPGVDRTLSLIDAFLGTLPDEHTELSITPEIAGDYASQFLLDKEHSTASDLEHTSSPTLLPQAEDDSIARALEGLQKSSPKSDETDKTSRVTISNQAKPESPTEETHLSEESLDESYFTETLAKIYIKQHKYSRALEIIRSLYLKYPEKNIYFADQIRFLEKLIINNNSK